MGERSKQIRSVVNVGERLRMVAIGLGSRPPVILLRGTQQLFESVVFDQFANVNETVRPLGRWIVEAPRGAPPQPVVEFIGRGKLHRYIAERQPVVMNEVQVMAASLFVDGSGKEQAVQNVEPRVAL